MTSISNIGCSVSWAQSSNRDLVPLDRIPGFLELSFPDQRELLRQAERVFDPDMPVREKRDIITALTKVKPEHWEWVMDDLLTLLDPDSPYCDSFDPPDMILSLSKIENREERTDILRLVEKLFHPEMDEPVLDQLIDTVAKIPKEEREEIIDLCRELLEDEECGAAKDNVLGALREIPKEESKKELVRLVLSWTPRGELTGEPIANILFCLMKVPARERAHLIQLATLFNGYEIQKKDGEDKSNLLEALSEVPFEDRSDVTYYALALNAAERWIEPKHVKEVAQIPKEERASFVLHHVKLISAETTATRKEHLIALVKAIHFSHRPSIILYLLFKAADHRIPFLEAIDTVPVDQIENVVHWAARIGTAQMTGEEKARVILALSAMADTDEKRNWMLNSTRNAIAPKLFTHEMPPADKIAFLQALATMRNYPLDEIRNILASGVWLFFDGLNENQKTTVIRQLADIRSKEERGEAITLASRWLFNSIMRGDEKAALVRQVATIEPESRETLVRRTHKLIRSDMTGSEILDVLKRVASDGNIHQIQAIQILRKRPGRENLKAAF